jgi:DNA-binding IclR family transcriptional regulator
MEPIPRVSEAVQRLKDVFQEMPSMRLTLADATRLSGLDRPMCHLVLMALEDARFVRRGRDGVYERGRSSFAES